jgi:uncharacterized repeat protein (TIGR02543 family)
MAIPNMRGALRGWTKKQTVHVVTKIVTDHQVVQTAESIVMSIMVQPLQPDKVNRKPEEQRSWKWFSIVTYSSDQELKIDDQIEVNSIRYRVQSVQPWSEAGYRRYEATEDYTGLSPIYALAYDGNEETSGTIPDTIEYQEGATPTVLANPFAKTGYTFLHWNTAANGSGTAYNPGDIITIGTDDVTLYAIWEAVP